MRGVIFACSLLRKHLPRSIFRSLHHIYIFLLLSFLGIVAVVVASASAVAVAVRMHTQDAGHLEQDTCKQKTSKAMSYIKKCKQHASENAAR